MDFELQQETFAAEITGLNFASGSEVRLNGAKNITQAEGKELKKLLHKYGVLFIRNQHDLKPEDLEHIARQFGDLRNIDAKPSVTSVSTDNPYIRAQHFDETPVEFPAGWFWHSDTTFLHSRPAVTVLWNHTVPKIGGDTLFADQRMAYSELSKGMRKYIQNLSCMHEIPYWFKNGTGEDQVERAVVGVHPETGESYLNVSEIFTTRIVGLPFEEAKYLLTFLQKHAVNDRWVHRHKWTSGCIAIWDNSSMQHKVIHNYWPAIRSGFRLETG